MPGLPTIDAIVISAYLAALVAIGVWTSRRVDSQVDYLLGGRRFGWITQTFASFGQATSADGPVGATATTFVNGASGIWSSLLMLFATPLFWITSPWLRRLRLVTMGDFFEDRYGSKRMASTYAVVATVGMMALIALGFAALTKTIVAMTPKPAGQLTAAEATEVASAQRLLDLRALPAEALTDAQAREAEALEALAPRAFIPSVNADTLVWAVCLLVILYAIAGGLEAAFYTDILQGIGILALSMLLLPTAWSKINSLYGGDSPLDALATLHAELPQHYFDIFGSPAAIDFTWYYIVAASLIATVTVVVQPNQMVTNSAAKSEMAARCGFVTGVIVKRVCTVLWGLFALAAILLYSDQVQDPDLTWGHAARDLLAPGLLGLMVASMLAALMSTADTLALTCTGLLLRNAYAPLAPGRSDRHYVRVGRLLGVIVLVGAAFLATLFQGILEIIKFIIEFFIVFAPALWLGLKWRRANRQGAWASILCTLLIFYIGPVVATLLYPTLRVSPWLAQQTAPREASATYQAVEVDVRRREAEIAAWRALPSDQRGGAAEPAPLAMGDDIELTTTLPARAIFWSAGVRTTSTGELAGRGYLYPEMAALQWVGFDLSRNSRAQNETARTLIRLSFPFIVMILVSLLTRRTDEERLHRFYTKMRTEVRSDREDDERRLAAALEDPSLVDRRLLIPGSDWEIYRWNRVDTVGFAAATAVVAGVLVLLVAAVGAGG